MCAVGNLCDNKNYWECASQDFYTWNFDIGFYKTNVTEHIKNEAKELIHKTGYSVSELIDVERIFIQNTGRQKTKEANFKGLEAVVEYLCELDNIPNVMDYSSLFEYNEKNEPVKELTL
jgi:P2-related tail formation protein